MPPESRSGSKLRDRLLPALVATDVVDAIRPYPKHLPALSPVHLAQADQQRIAVHLDVVDPGPTTPVPALLVPGEHLRAVLAGRVGIARSAPMDVWAEQSRELFEVRIAEGNPDPVRDAGRCHGRVDPGRRRHFRR